MVARGQRGARTAAERRRPVPPGPCARAPARRAELAAEPLGPRAPLNEWGRRAGAGLPRPAPGPGPGPAPGRIGFPHRRPPGSARTGCSARLSRAWGAGTQRAPRAPAESCVPDPSAPLPPAWLVPRGRPRTRPAPSPPDAPLRPDVGGCGGGAEAGRDSSPSLGLRAPSAGGFIYRAKQSWPPPPPPPSRAQRLQGLSAGAGGPQDPGLLAKSRGASAGVTWPGARGWGTPPATPHPRPSIPGSLLHSLGWVTEKALAQGARGAGREHPCQNSYGRAPPLPPTISGFWKAECRPGLEGRHLTVYEERPREKWRGLPVGLLLPTCTPSGALSPELLHFIPPTNLY